MADETITEEIIEPEETYIAYGGSVKAVQVEDGWQIKAPLVVFTSPQEPDLTGDYFDATTDFDMEFPGKSTTYFNHGIDSHFKKRRLAPSNLVKDEFGVWAESILHETDEYEKFLIELAKQGRLGMSSGVPGHLVEREPVGKAQHITYWPLGKDASFTHTPAEPKTRYVIPLKSLINIQEAGEAGEDNPATDEIKTQSTESSSEIPEVTNLMEDSEIQTKVDEAVKAAIAALPPTNTAGILTSKKAPAVIEGTGDTGTKAFVRWARTGDVSTGLKAENPWNEGTAGDGAVLVPDDFYARIITKAAEKSIVRAAGALTITTSRDKITIPVENDAMAAFVTTAEETGSATITETTPLAQKDIALVKYTRMVKVSAELLSDAVVNIESFLAMQLASAKALTENNIFLVGAGDGDPAVQGIYVGGTAGLTLDSATAIAVSEVPELFFKLNAAYADNAVWFMKHATLGYIRSLRDEYNFAFMANPQGVLNGGLMGKPVFVSDQNAAIGSGLKPIVIGDPNYYCIVDNPTMFVSRNPYLYQANDLVGFFAKFRVGGAVLQAEAFQYATHPTA